MELSISDWISDVCSSDLGRGERALPDSAWPGAAHAARPCADARWLRLPWPRRAAQPGAARPAGRRAARGGRDVSAQAASALSGRVEHGEHRYPVRVFYEDTDAGGIVYHARYLHFAERSEEHTSELQSLMRISYAVF